jgi:hypothetical protein
VTDYKFQFTNFHFILNGCYSGPGDTLSILITKWNKNSTPSQNMCIESLQSMCRLYRLLVGATRFIGYLQISLNNNFKCTHVTRRSLHHIKTLVQNLCIALHHHTTDHWYAMQRFILYCCKFVRSSFKTTTQDPADSWYSSPHAIFASGHCQYKLDHATRKSYQVLFNRLRFYFQHTESHIKQYHSLNKSDWKW